MNSLHSPVLQKEIGPSDITATTKALAIATSPPLSGMAVIAAIKDTYPGKLNLSSPVEKVYASRLQTIIDANPASQTADLDQMLVNGLLKLSLLRNMLVSEVDTNSDGKLSTLAEINAAKTRLQDVLNGVHGNTTDPTPTQPLQEKANARNHTLSTIDNAALKTSIDPIVQALDYTTHNTNWKWDKSSLTYSFNTSLPSEYQTLGLSLTSWQPVASNVQAVVDAHMQAADQLIALSITKIATNGDIRLNALDTIATGANGFAYPPNPPFSYAGDIFLSKTIGTTTSASDDVRTGKYGSATISHELGHALGLKHPFAETDDPQDDINLPPIQDNRVNTIMSYTDFRHLFPTFSVEKKATGNYMSADYSLVYADNFMVFDIAALQAMYGADLSTRTENNTYYFDPTGTVRATVYQEGAFYHNLPIYHTIWDAGGVDTLDFSTTTNPNVIRLTSGSYSDVNYQSVESQISAQQQKYRTELGTNYFDHYINDVFSNYSNDIYTGEKALGIAYGAIIENATGGQSDDQFYDNAVNNILIGNAGDDTFYLGAGGFDAVQGGSGADRLVLNVTRNNVQMEKQQTGATLLVADMFAVTLAGIESIQFSDQLYNLA